MVITRLSPLILRVCVVGFGCGAAQVKDEQLRKAEQRAAKAEAEWRKAYAAWKRSEAESARLKRALAQVEEGYAREIASLRVRATSNPVVLAPAATHLNPTEVKRVRLRTGVELEGWIVEESPTSLSLATVSRGNVGKTVLERVAKALKRAVELSGGRADPF